MIKQGIDLGSNSVAVSVVDEENQKISAFVKIFPAGVDAKTQAGNNQKKREARLGRRQIKRRRVRKNKIVNFFKDNFGVNPRDLDPKLRVISLRGKGDDTPLELIEFAASILHIAKNRGPNYSLDSKVGSAKKADQPVKDSMRKLKKTTEEYNTLSKYFNKVFQESGRYRNKGEDYTFTPHRSMIENDFEKIFDFQASVNDGNQWRTKLTEECKEELRNIIFSQKDIAPDKSALSHDSLEPHSHCALKSTRLAQEFLMYKEVNDVRIDGKSLTEEQRDHVIELLKTNVSVTKTKLKKELKLLNKCSISWSGNQEKLIGNWFEFYVMPLIGDMDEKSVESISDAISKLDDDEKKVNRFKRKLKALGVPEHITEKLIELDVPSGRINYSKATLNNILPYMKEERISDTIAKTRFSEECHSYQQKKRYNGMNGLNRQQRNYMNRQDKNFRMPYPPQVTNPTARKTLHILREVQEDLVNEFGIPDEIFVESAREIRQSANVRMEMNKKNQKINKLKEDIDLIIRKKGFRTTKKSTERVRLWIEQKGLCAYSGEYIDINSAIQSDSVEIDHIVPYSWDLDNSLSNKVLVTTKENRDKGNQLPSQAFSKEKLREVKSRMDHMKKDGKFETEFGTFEIFKSGKKIKNLARTDGPREQDRFLNYQLSATAYSETVAKNWLQSTFYNEYKNSYEKVQFPKGAWIAMLRKHWGLDYLLSSDGKKNRNDHRHHVIDAVVIALCTKSRIKQMVDIKKQEEIEYKKNGKLSDDRVTIPLPWKTFKEDLKNVIDAIVVNHTPKRKQNFPLHEETLYGNSKEENCSTKRVNVWDLTWKNLTTPAGYQELYEKRAALSSRDKEKRKQINSEMDELIKNSKFSYGSWGVVKEYDVSVQLKKLFEKYFGVEGKICPKKLKELSDNGQLTLNGKDPVKKVVLKITLNKSKTVRINKNNNVLVYKSGNNHHAVFYLDEKNKPSMKVVNHFNAKQIIDKLKEKQQHVDLQDIVESYFEGEYLIALRIGDVVEDKEKNRFVVKKMEEGKIEMQPNNFNIEKNITKSPKQFFNTFL